MDGAAAKATSKKPNKEMVQWSRASSWTPWLKAQVLAVDDFDNVKKQERKSKSVCSTSSAAESKRERKKHSSVFLGRSFSFFQTCARLRIIIMKNKQKRHTTKFQPTNHDAKRPNLWTFIRWRRRCRLGGGHDGCRIRPAPRTRCNDEK